LIALPVARFPLPRPHFGLAGARLAELEHHPVAVLHRAGLGDVDADDLGMANGAAQDAADKRVGMIEIGGVAGASRHLLDAVDQRNFAPFGTADIDRRGHDAAMPAAARTDSRILT